MKRFLTSAVGILVMIPVCIYSHTVIWPAAVTVFSFFGVYEILGCIGMRKELKFTVPSYLFSLAPLMVWLFCDRAGNQNQYQLIYILGAVYFLSMLTVATFVHNKLHSEKLFATISFVFYVSFSFTALVLLRRVPNGKYIYLLAFLGAWVSDTFAFLCGKLFGKHQLCPNISPKKTVEGSIGAIIANAVFFIGYGYIMERFFSFQVNYIFFALFGVILSVIGQFGDSFASCIKRHYGIKDYGSVFPGHGGSLDRFDSVLVVADTLYIIYALFGLQILIR